MVEKTLVIIKPDAYQKNVIGEIISTLEKNRLKIIAIRSLRLSKEQAEEFYNEHKDKDFFERLVEFMTSDTCIPMVVEGENAIENVRDILGNTDPSRAKPGTLRYIYGTNLPMNAIHASDSLLSARREIKFFFPEIEI